MPARWTRQLAWASVGASQPPVVSVRLCRRSRRAGAGRLRDVRRHEPRRGAEALRAGARREIPDPGGRCQQDRSEILSPDRALRQPRKRPARSSSIPAITTFTASKATETPPATAPMSAATGSCGAVTLMSGARPNGPIWTPPKEMIQRQPEARQICRRHAGRSRQSARRPHALSLSERRLHALHDLQHQRPRDRSGPTLRAAAPASSART